MILIRRKARQTEDDHQWSRFQRTAWNIIMAECVTCTTNSKLNEYWKSIWNMRVRCWTFMHTVWDLLQADFKKNEKRSCIWNPVHDGSHCVCDCECSRSCEWVFRSLRAPVFDSFLWWRCVFCRSGWQRSSKRLWCRSSCQINPLHPRCLMTSAWTSTATTSCWTGTVRCVHERKHTPALHCHAD